MRSRRADAVLFGFDFQRNAAVVLEIKVNVVQLKMIVTEEPDA